MPIRSELLKYKQWVLWLRTEVNGRTAKLAISPWSGKVASCDKPQTWSTYNHVCYARRKPRLLSSAWRAESHRCTGDLADTAFFEWCISRALPDARPPIRNFKIPRPGIPSSTTLCKRAATLSRWALSLKPSAPK